jgi:hypothetical protein
VDSALEGVSFGNTGASGGTKQADPLEEVIIISILAVIALAQGWEDTRSAHYVRSCISFLYWLNNESSVFRHFM